MNREPRPSLGEVTYDKLVEMLASPDFPEGSRLPSEHDLSRRFAVSRPILRQALGRLQSEGKLETRKGSGTTVLAKEVRLSIPFGPLSSIPDVAAFLEFRCSLESEMAAHAARHADRAALNVIRQARRALDKQISLKGSAIEEDIAFHLAIGSASGNRFFVTVLQSLREQIVFSIRLTRDLSTRPVAERLLDIRREHTDIENAIMSGDSSKAHKAMADHLHGGIARLFGTQVEPMPVILETETGT